MPHITTIVVGAGWSGLACAYELCKANHKVILLEAAPQIGGRARAIQFDNNIVDNGQHVCLSAYHNLKQILSDLGLEQNQLFHDIPLELIAHSKQKLHIKLPNIKAPWHFIFGIINAKNFSIIDKFRLLKFCSKLARMNFNLEYDCSLEELLTNYHQSKFLIQNFWEPLALAIMTTPIATASAQVFLNVLKISFMDSNSGSNWLLPKKDLSTILPEYIANFISKNQAEIHCNNAVKKIEIVANKCVALHTKTQSWHADNIVLAIPPWQVYPLLQPYSHMQQYNANLMQCGFEPITTVYLVFPVAVDLGFPIQGFIGSLAQWIFDRSFCNQPNIISVIISGAGEHLSLSQEAICNAVLEEIRFRFPELPDPISTKVIREKRAAFTCSVKQHALRPDASTPISNLWLSGDYVQNGLPATLEGAVLNGMQTARLVNIASL